jgi:hypothetical protein
MHTKRQIRDAFKRMGLDTEEARSRFKSLTSLDPKMTAQRLLSIRTDSGTYAKSEEENAELERNPR